MHLLQIPRAVVVMAGGNYSGATNDDGQAVIEVAAEIKPRQSYESLSMAQKASTRSFSQKIIVGDGKMSYSQTTLVDIYGKKKFVHTDANKLTRR